MNHHRDELLAAFNRIEALEAEVSEGRNDARHWKDQCDKLKGQRDEARALAAFKLSTMTRLAIEQERDRLAAEVMELRYLLSTPEDGSVMQVQALRAELAKYKAVAETVRRATWEGTTGGFVVVGECSWERIHRALADVEALDAKPGQGDA